MELAKSLSRLGTESAFSVLAEAKKLEAQGKPMIHLGLGQPDFKTPKHVVDAAKKALDDGHHGYVLSNGILECRQAVTRWIKKRYSAEVDPERIIIMPGGKPTMHYAIQCFGELTKTLYCIMHRWFSTWHNYNSFRIYFCTVTFFYPSSYCLSAF